MTTSPCPSLRSNIRLAFQQLSWGILRKKLNLYAYKPHKVIPHSVENMEGRVNFCTWLLADLTPMQSPDLSPLDFWSWGVCKVELSRHLPSSMAELRATINSLAKRTNPKLKTETCMECQNSHNKKEILT